MANAAINTITTLAGEPNAPDANLLTPIDTTEGTKAVLARNRALDVSLA